MSGIIVGGFNNLHRKIAIHIDSNKEIESLISKPPLWFSYEEQQPEVEAYAEKIASSSTALNSMGDTAILVYGGIISDDPHISLTNENTGVTKNFGLVDHLYEYYFTDLVFIQQRYEEALVDLYTLRAENPENLSVIDEAIDNTFWIAEQNGVKLTPDKVQELYLKQLNVRLDNLRICLELLDDNNYCPGIKKYATGISNAVYQYYKTPSEVNQINMWNTINGLVGTYFREGTSKGLTLLIIEMTNASGLDFPELPKNLQAKKQLVNN